MTAKLYRLCSSVHAPGRTTVKPCSAAQRSEHVVVSTCPNSQPSQAHPQFEGRRSVLIQACALLTFLPSANLVFAAETESQVQVLATAALQAYSDNDLPRARGYFDKLVDKDAANPVWLERRGQVLVDLKLFEDAIRDFNAAERMYKDTVSDDYVSLGLLSNRALAYEGLYRWKEAIDDYSQAIKLGSEVGYSIPYVLNSRGNCHASIAARFTLGSNDPQGPPLSSPQAPPSPPASGPSPEPPISPAVLESPCVQSAAGTEWQLAREDFRASASVFQRSRNLPGAIFASSNAALVSAQLGDDVLALQELKTVARRAPGSIDMRAAIAAIYWAAGRQDDAEQYWNWACSKINSGQLVPGGPILDSCDRYNDPDWLRRIRRWPPIMVDRMGDFLALRPPTQPANLPSTA